MEIKEFWENAHKNDEELWLTGSYLNQIWPLFQITDKLKPGIKVLNIGVGLGRDTQELHTKKTIVDVLDISQIALDRVKSITRRQFLSSNLKDLPINEYDIAVSHLVTQHMNDTDLVEQIQYVLRSLKPDGIFAMQFAFIDDTPENREHLNRVYYDVINVPTNQKGHMFRTLLEMKNIVEIKCEGKISWISDVRTYPNNPIKWYYIHIKQNTKA
jgi:SAM-dependent methyltransferase